MNNSTASGGRPAAHGGPGAYVKYFGGSSLGYGAVDSRAPIKAPTCSPNGGLFTGEPFTPGAPYGNVPTVPEADYMTNVNLRSARPPTEALYQYASFLRPGNNHVEQPGIGTYSERHQMACMREAAPPAPCSCKSECDCAPCYYGKQQQEKSSMGWDGFALYHK